MKIKYIKLGSYIRQLILFSITSFILFDIRIFSQIKPEFIISDSAFVGDMAIDNDNNIHIVLDRREDIIYRKYDSLFNPISDFKAFNNTSKTSDTKFAIRNNYMVTVWRDFKLLMFYNSEIVGNISDITEGELNSSNFFVNEEFYDANRFSPDVCFIDDTTFFVIWYGDGPYTYNRDIYGRFFSVSAQPLTPDILISDRYNDISKGILPKILYCKKSNKLFTTWVSDYGNKYRIWCRLFYPTGTPVDSSFIISDDPLMTEVYEYDAAIDSNGNFVAAWAAQKDSIWELQWRCFNSNGEPLTQVETISSFEDSVASYSYINVAINRDGKSILSWDKGGNELGSKKYAKRFDSCRNPIGNGFRISENDSTYESRSVLSLSNDRVFYIWNASGYEPYWYGTLGKIIDFNNPTDIVEDINANEHLNSFELSANYPNPFNNTTKIKYTIPPNDKRLIFNIKLKVYDILGNEITTLVDKKQSAGEYEIEFNAGKFPSGVYVYVLQGGDLVKINKMILIK